MSIQISEMNGTVIENNDGHIHIKCRNIKSLKVNGKSVIEEKDSYTYKKLPPIRLVTLAVVLGVVFGICVSL